MKLWMAYAAGVVSIGLIVLMAVAGCAKSPPDCQQSASGITNATVNFSSACGGSGDHAGGSNVNPPPVIVPPVVAVPPGSTVQEGRRP